MSEARTAIDGDLLELAALDHAWEYWARAKQIPPITDWRSWGFITGRGFGKTRSACEFIVSEVQAGRARRIGFTSFNLDEAERTMIHGESGLLRCSPPWFPAEVVKGQVVWPNGATATPYTPEVPDGPRGPEHDLFWCSEVAAWPRGSADEFFSNIRMGLRLGLGRMVFDTTPKARNPLVRYLIARAKRDAAHHVLVTGSTRENADNLTADFVTELVAEYGGTRKGEEELEGKFFDDTDGALFKQAWIDDNRRKMPTDWKRRVVSIDPAISTRKGTDETGVVCAGLAVDDQVIVTRDLTDRHAWEAWGTLVTRVYFEDKCDCVIVERNRGGDAVAANLRACAEKRGLRIEVVAADAVTKHLPGVVFVKETISRKGKALRAEPVASLYERGRVSHVEGADLLELEESITTWTPDGGGDSPNAMDAMVQAVADLANLHRGGERDRSKDIDGALKAQAMLSQPKTAPSAPVSLVALLGGRTRGDRI